MRLGHFDLLEEIGRGGMCVVYRAFDPTLTREVAIKVLRDELSGDPKFVNDFLREARVAAAIRHPQIVHLHFAGEEAGRAYMVMELLRGRTLAQTIAVDGPLDEERTLQIAIDVARVLQAAYEHEMIHGDIKPQNIFLSEEMGTKLLDFGMAKAAHAASPGDGAVWGSAHYLSPERAGRRVEDFHSDVYSLGATLFEALTGRPPFQAPGTTELALKRLNEKPPLLRELIPQATPRVEEVVDKMLNRSPLLRYRDYDHLLEDLQDAKTEATAKRLGVRLHPVLEPPEPLEDAGAPPREPRALITMLTLVAILLSAQLIGRELKRADWLLLPFTAAARAAGAP